MSARDDYPICARDAEDLGAPMVQAELTAMLVEIDRLRSLATKLVIAIEHTRDYVGHDVLPAIEGWSWFDAVKAWEAEFGPRPAPVAPVVVDSRSCAPSPGGET